MLYNITIKINITIMYMKKIDIMQGKENLFYSEVGKHSIFVKFYMDGCPHCENMKQDWIDLENELLNNYSGDLTVMSVNARTLNTLKSPLTSQVNGFPTIFMIERDGSKGLDFQGERTKDDMLKFVLENTKDVKKNVAFQNSMIIPAVTNKMNKRKPKKHKSKKHKTKKLKSKINNSRKRKSSKSKKSKK